MGGTLNTNIRRRNALNAIKAGNLKRLETLILSKADANLTLPKRSWSLLDEAVGCEKHDIAKWLLDHGANPNTLHVSPGLLRRMGMPIHIEPELYFSPLASAIEKEDVQMVRIFLDAGADLNLPKYSFPGHISTCHDALNEKPALRAKVEALAISAPLGEPSREKRAFRSL
jgi:hypothetical protein